MLAAGSRLGPYTILAPLGAGGMGEVYRARDPRLGREVAVKVLPAEVSADGDRLRRFEQEARAASALNHPNILTVFDTGSHDGTVYLVTELLEGETLRGRLAGGALPARKAVEIAVQVARGLAAAHERGIVHRDLKPENLFLTRDGRVKILDFGLAKLQAHAIDSPSDLAAAPTLLTETESGVVLGTVGYMAPEQVRGRPADHRADLFALGAILYEMLAGRRAFQRDSAAETMTAILREEPPDLAESGKTVLPGLEQVVRHCLEKDPHHRFQSASDLAFALESLSALSGTGAAVPPSPSGRRRGRLRAAAAAGLLLTAGLLAGILAQRQWGQSEPPRFQRLTFRRGNVLAARFAPDGQTIVHSATWDGEPIQVFTTRTDSPEARSLGLPSAILQSISPGGEMLIELIQRSGGIRVGSTLAQVPLAGGAPRPILEARSVWADWMPDGKSFSLLLHLDDEARIEYPRGKVIWRSTNLTWDLRVAPTGDALAFCEARGGTLSFVVLDRAGKVVTRSDGWGLPQLIRRSPAGCVGWAPDGDEVWFAAARPGGESGLYALTRGGEVRPLLHAPGTLALLDVGRDGRALLAQFNPRMSIVVRAPGEMVERDLSWFEDSELADLSADGRWILFSDRGQRDGAQMSVYLRGTDGSPAVRLGDGWALALSPDGRWALAGSEDDRLLLLPTGAGEPRALPSMSMEVDVAKWLPGGKQILFTGAEPGKRVRLYVLDLETKEVRPVIREEGIRFYLPSPDGSGVAVWGRDGMKLYPIGGGEPRPVPATSLAGDYPLRWRTDGRVVYIGRRGEGGRYWIDEIELATGKRSPWKELRVADPVAAVIRYPVVTPDGKAYAYSLSDTQSTLYLVEGLR